MVPVETASPKEEYSAGTIRRKIQKELDYFMVPLEENLPEKSSLDFDLKQLRINSKKFDLENLEKSVKRLKLKENLSPCIFKGGTRNALELFPFFWKIK